MPAEELPVVTAPPTFKDAEGRLWTIKLTLGSIDDVQAATKLDLMPDGKDVSAVTGLLFDHRKLGAVLWALCGPQAEKQSIDRKSFADALDADSLAKGWQAVTNAVIFFIRCQNEKLGDAIERMIEAEMSVVEAGAEQMLEAVQSTEVSQGIKEAAARIGKEMREGTVKQLANFATKSQA